MGCMMCHGSYRSAKMRASALAGILFVVLASPRAFALVQTILGGLVRITSNNTPTAAGLLIHGAVYALIVYALMRHHHRRRMGYSAGGQYGRQW